MALVSSFITCRASSPVGCASAQRSLADEVTEILRRERKTAILVTHDIGEAVSMAERVIVLSRRPGRIKSNHAIRFASAGGARPAPLAARNAPEFNAYFRTLWQELEVHVEG